MGNTLTSGGADERARYYGTLHTLREGRELGGRGWRGKQAFFLARAPRSVERERKRESSSLVSTDQPRVVGEPRRPPPPSLSGLCALGGLFPPLAVCRVHAREEEGGGGVECARAREGREVGCGGDFLFLLFLPSRAIFSLQPAELKTPPPPPRSKASSSVFNRRIFVFGKPNIRPQKLGSGNSNIRPNIQIRIYCISPLVRIEK